MESLQGPSLFIAAGEEIIYEGQEDHSAFVLREGWAYSYKRLPDGSRQILDLHIPGDFLGFRCMLLRASDHSFAGVTHIEVARIRTDRLLAATIAAPRLTAALLWAASRDQAMMAEHLVSIAKRSALVRTAHFLLELEARMRLIGRSSADAYECPVSQLVLADVLGITAVHLSRVLRQLRERGYLILRNGTVTFLNKRRLVELTGFDRSYLDQGSSRLH